MPQETSEYRNQLFLDVYNGRIPDRVPEKLNILSAAVYEFGGYDLRYHQYGITKYIDALDKVSAEFDTDLVVGTIFNPPWLNKILGSRTRVMGSDGFIQHPNVEGMREDEYPELIADPIKFIWDKAIPRLYTELAKPAPYNAFALLKAQKLSEYVNGKIAAARAEIAKKYNKVTVNLTARVGGKIPLDYLGDFLRSFTGILIDIRRRPEQVLQALEVLTPIITTGRAKKYALKEPQRHLRAGCAPHMPTFMRIKDFEKFYWPGFKQAMWERYEAGYGVNVFCEDNWMHLIDYLYELPPGTELQFEYGDPKELKKRLGDKHIISGLFPSTILKTGTKKEVEYKAKELIDILGPGGNFVFSFDKSIMRQSTVNWENFKVLIETVHTYGKY